MKYKHPVIALIVILAVAVLVIFLVGLLKRTSGKQESGKRLRIVTTLFPLYDFAKNIAGPDADVTLLLPPGVEPHTYEPKPSDVVKINQADIFLYTGANLEAWVPDVLAGINNRRLRVVNASRGITLVSATSEGLPATGESADPHIWLDFANDRTIVKSISSAIIDVDPANRTIYEKNTTEYLLKLARLDQEYKDGLAQCRKNTIVYGGHYAFGYLARRYHLNYEAAQGLSPDTEPTAVDLANLLKQVKIENIKYVYYEELASPKVSQVLSAESGAKLLMLNAAHNISRDQLATGVSFIDIMKSNLENLRIGLECK